MRENVVQARAITRLEPFNPANLLFSGRLDKLEQGSAPNLRKKEFLFLKNKAEKLLKTQEKLEKTNRKQSGNEAV